MPEPPYRTLSRCGLRWPRCPIGCGHGMCTGSLSEISEESFGDGGEWRGLTRCPFWPSPRDGKVRPGLLTWCLTTSSAHPLSLIVPSGNSNLGQGFGATGIQTNLPISIVLNRKSVTHWNTGSTFVPHARNSDGQRASGVAYNFGQSVIWETMPRFNVMMETFLLSAQKVVKPGKTEWSNTLFLSR